MPVVLRYWRFFPDESLESVILYGVNAKVRMYSQSQPIVQRLANDAVLSSSGVLYHLEGQPNAKSLAEIFGQQFAAKFRFGFPENWESLIEKKLLQIRKSTGNRSRIEGKVRELRQFHMSESLEEGKKCFQIAIPQLALDSNELIFDSGDFTQIFLSGSSTLEEAVSKFQSVDEYIPLKENRFVSGEESNHLSSLFYENIATSCPSSGSAHFPVEPCKPPQTSSSASSDYEMGDDETFDRTEAVTLTDPTFRKLSPACVDVPSCFQLANNLSISCKHSVETSSSSSGSVELRKPLQTPTSVSVQGVKSDDEMSDASETIPLAQLKGKRKIGQNKISCDWTREEYRALYKGYQRFKHLPRRDGIWNRVKEAYPVLAGRSRKQMAETWCKTVRPIPVEKLMSNEPLYASPMARRWSDDVYKVIADAYQRFGSGGQAYQKMRENYPPLAGFNDRQLKDACRRLQVRKGLRSVMDESKQ